jgi:hypothetical protein
LPSTAIASSAERTGARMIARKRAGEHPPLSWRRGPARAASTHVSSGSPCYGRCLFRHRRRPERNGRFFPPRMASLPVRA